MKKTLSALFKEIIHEAEINSTFRARLENALGIEERAVKQRAKPPESDPHRLKRPTNRRPPAMVDPVHLARQGEDVLRVELEKLSIEQLRDVIADYGMDTGKLALKWRDTGRIIERIVEVARSRAQKGNAFRDQAPGDNLIDRISQTSELPDGSDDGG